MGTDTLYVTDLKWHLTATLVLSLRTIKRQLSRKLLETGHVYRTQTVGSRPGSDAATANKHGVMRRNPAYAEMRTVVHYCDSKRRNERAGINDRLYVHTHTHTLVCETG